MFLFILCFFDIVHVQIYIQQIFWGPNVSVFDKKIKIIIIIMLVGKELKWPSNSRRYLPSDLLLPSEPCTDKHQSVCFLECGAFH